MADNKVSDLEIYYREKFRLEDEIAEDKAALMNKFHRLQELRVTISKEETVQLDHFNVAKAQAWKTTFSIMDEILAE